MKKRLLSILFCMGLIVSLSTTAYGVDICASYKDLCINAWYHNGVHFALQNGIMSGTGSDTFSPNEKTSRAMLVTILYSLSGRPSVFGLSGFQDVKSGSYYEIPVLWADHLRLTAGTGTTTFSPNEAVKRQDAAVFLRQYAALRGYPTSQAASLSSYTDAGKISDYAVDAMRWAVAIGAVNGVSPEQLAPKSTATRAEIATMVMRMMQYYKMSFSPDSSKVNHDLQNAIQRTIQNETGSFGVYVEQLSEGASIYAKKNTDYHAQVVSASLIKLWVMGAVYEKVEAGTIPESSVSAKLKHMITVSDNQACNDLVRLLGNGNRNAGIKAVNTFIQAHGFSETKMTRLMLENTGTQNYTSVRDCADFLRMLYRGELVSAKASQSMLNVMKNAHRIYCAAGLPSTVPFAHKTGSLINLCYADVGIVFADRPYILCVIQSGSSNGPGALQSISLLVYQSLK